MSDVTDKLAADFKADFAALLAKYDAEMSLSEDHADYYRSVNGVLFSMSSPDHDYIEVNVGTWADKDNL